MQMQSYDIATNPDGQRSWYLSKFLRCFCIRFLKGKKVDEGLSIRFYSFKQMRFLSSGGCRFKTNTGFCCVPFMYRRRLYRGCAPAKNGRTWCAITPDYNRNKLWGYCRGGKKRKTTTFSCNTYTII